MLYLTLGPLRLKVLALLLHVAISYRLVLLGGEPVMPESTHECVAFSSSDVTILHFAFKPQIPRHIITHTLNKTN